MSNRTFSVQKSQIHNFLTLSVISGNSEIATMEYQNKNFSSYSIRIKSVWLWFPASPWLNLWLIFLKSLKNSSRDLYNSFCGLESFKKCPSQGRVISDSNWTWNSLQKEHHIAYVVEEKIYPERGGVSKKWRQHYRGVLEMMTHDDRGTTRSTIAMTVTNSNSESTIIFTSKLEVWYKNYEI